MRLCILRYHRGEMRSTFYAQVSCFPCDLNNSCPKYYDNRKFPIDIHCPAQLFVTLAKLGKITDNKELVNKVLLWTIKNMQSPKGYFYYQLKPGISSKISYMRWSNAFMFYALTYLLNEYNNN